jgi:hypothetical protein
MNHWNYVAMAYGSFAILMLWDFIAPQIALKKSIRAIVLRTLRKKSS